MNTEALLTPSLEGGLVETTVFVQDALGLHARPAARLAQTAQQFESHITLSRDTLEADAKSILDILTLAAERGTSLTVRCIGKDAAEAAQKMETLFKDSVLAGEM